MRLIPAIVLSAALLLSGAAVAQSGNSCGRDGEYASLSGSRWVGTFTWDGDPPVTQTMTLLPSCVLKYGYKGATYTNGRWLQRGSMVVWDTNDHYAVYLGRIDGRRMSGVMNNENGDAGTWSFKRAD